MKEHRRAASILMVDDRVENLVALEAVLQPLGHTLVRALSGEEALRSLLRRDFAVILLDVQMPGMNGFETASIIKARERSRHTPIIFLTAISKEEEYVFEGYSAGAVDYIFKPFNPEILRSKVSVFVDLYAKGQQIREQNELLRKSERREIELLHRTRLLESEAKYAQIVDSATDSIITLSDDQRITLFNAAAEQTFGVPRAEAIGETIDRFIHLPGSGGLPGASVDEPKPENGKAEAGEGRISTTIEAVGRRTDGETFPVEYTASTLQLQEGRIATLIIRDISARREAEEQLRTQKESLENTMEELRTLNEELSDRTAELERAMGARSRFYASMSHELRTPINAILGYTALLLDNIYGPLNEKQVSSIRRTNLAGTHLLELVNDILDLSKIEAGKLELQFESVEFPMLVRDLFVTVAPFAESHSVELSFDSSEPTWSMVTDPRKIRQIALNLLSNAIKFGAGNPVEVSCVRGEDDGLILDVRDHGPGIQEEDLERIFEEFVQLDESPDDPGTGLGLPISRRLAELLGGSLTVTSTPGEGSLFRLEVPRIDTEQIARGGDVVRSTEGASA